MQQHQLRPPKGAKRRRKIVGRGDGSGHGSYSGKGMKGQKARSGRGVRLGFQGGQNPLIKSLPSLRGFTNIFRREYIAINLDRLAEFPANSEVTPQLLAKAGVLKSSKQRIKVLGRGELEVPLVVEAHRFSRSAREKIEAVGGQAREID